MVEDERKDERKIVVIGAGGHARVIVSTLRAAGHTVSGILDDNSDLWGSKILGLDVDGPVERVEESSDLRAIVGVGNAHIRKSLVDRLNVEWASVVHPFSWVDPTATLGPGTVVFAGAVVQPETQIGSHCIINTSATVDHNCWLSDYVQVCPGVNLSGRVYVEEGTFIGVGAAVLETIRLGAWSIVGGGAVIIRDLPEQVVAVGSPAKVIRRLGELPVATPSQSKVRKAVESVVRRILSESGRSVDLIHDDDSLTEKLWFDSLDLAVTVVGLEKELGVDPFREDAPRTRTFGDLVGVYENALGSIK